MSAAVAAVSTVEIAAAMKATAAVKLSASVEVAATVTVAAVEVSAAIAPIVAASIAAMTVIAVLAAAIISTATVAVSASVVAVPVIAVIPGACADEDAANEPVRAIKTVGRAGVWIVVVVAIFADRRGAVINGGANSDAEGDALGVGVRRCEKTDRETNAE